MFKKGVSGNPSGRTKLPDELQAIKRITRDEVVALVSKFFRMPIPALDAHLKNPKCTGIEFAIIKNVRDYRMLGWLLDRTIGKVVEQVAVLPLGNPEDYAEIPPAVIMQLAAGLPPGSPPQAGDNTPQPETIDAQAVPVKGENSGEA
jgi:hypothetical protein